MHFIMLDLWGHEGPYSDFDSRDAVHQALLSYMDSIEINAGCEFIRVIVCFFSNLCRNKFFCH